MLVKSDFQSYFPFNNGHVETLVPYFLRPVQKISYKRERLETLDHDFVDLDWLKIGSEKLVVLSHGLEGCTRSRYMLGMASYLGDRGFDVLAWNQRSCSGELNRLIPTYHSGFSHDLRQVITHALSRHQYQQVYLVGFSLGGNVTLKYLGEEADQIDPRIKAAAAISTPVSLEDCAKALSSPMGRVYTKNFILRMTSKIKQKKQIFPEFEPDIRKLNRAWDFETFDNLVTAPIFGFDSAQDYWQQASSLPLLTKIETPSLIINALNDPFLSGDCFPSKMLQEHPVVHLETPETGGHVGFLSGSMSDVWTEPRVFQHFLSEAP
jgi:predicted alpha/beta-fold hydrolase